MNHCIVFPKRRQTVYYWKNVLIKMKYICNSFESLYIFFTFHETKGLMLKKKVLIKLKYIWRKMFWIVTYFFLKDDKNCSILKTLFKNGTIFIKVLNQCIFFQAEINDLILKNYIIIKIKWIFNNFESFVIFSVLGYNETNDLMLRKKC